MSAVNAGRNSWRAQSDARIAALNGELLTKLINAAFDVLGHDASPDDPAMAHNTEALRRKFARVLKIKLPTT